MERAAKQPSLDNSIFVRILGEVGDLLEIQGANPFRVRAYRNAARRLEDLRESVSAMTEEELTKLGGIGKDLAHKIQTIAQTGSLPLLDDLRKVIPSALRQIILVPGIGPKRAYQLLNQLNVRNLNDLRRAAEQHQIRTLKGFGPKSEERIHAALLGMMTKPTTGRMLFSEARPYAEAVVAYLQGSPGLSQMEVAGSFRRRQETVGDLDLVAACSEPAVLMDRLAQYRDVTNILARGQTKMIVMLNNQLQLDLRVVQEDAFGAALQYFTGSKSHSIQLRRRAMARGLKLNEYGVFRKNQRLGGRTEQEVYGALDLALIPPELREAHGEIELAAAGNLPKLIELRDIRGDLHMHTTASDGRSTLREMVEAAKERGYNYIAITEHSRRVKIAHGLDAKRLRAHWQAIDKVAAEVKDIAILKGIELDILEDGKLDLPDKVLEEADWVLAALHYGLRQSQAQITRRLLKAIKNPLVSAIAHPSTRILGRRAAAALNLVTVLTAASEYGCILELDSQPNRLDLDDAALALAKRHNVPIVIDSDAHSAGELRYIEYGIFQARRGGIEARDVVNTKSLEDFLQLLKRKKGRAI